jgi:acyl carrier protein
MITDGPASCDNGCNQKGGPAARDFRIKPLDIERETLITLDRVLVLQGRALGFGPATPLLGALPELDSMAVASLLTGLEEHFGFIVHDDEVEGAIFATVGSLTTFVRRKLGA